MIIITRDDQRETRTKDRTGKKKKKKKRGQATIEMSERHKATSVDANRTVHEVAE